MDLITAWNPDEDQWWVTGFNPECKDEKADAKNQVMIGSVKLSNMYSTFKRKYSPDDSNIVLRLSNKTPYTLIFDDKEETYSIRYYSYLINVEEPDYQGLSELSIECEDGQIFVLGNYETVHNDE